MKKIIFIFVIILTTQLQGIFDYDRAIAKSQKGAWEESKELLKNVLIENPDNPEIVYDMGVSSFKNKEPEKAVSYFSKAAQSAHASQSLQEQAYYNAGNAHVQLKQLPEAIDAYDHALAINPSNKHAAHNKELVKKMLEEQKEKEDDQNNKEKQDQEKNQDTNNKDSEKNSEDAQKQDQENKNNQEKKKNEQDQKESEEKNRPDKKEQEAKNKKEEEQKKLDEKKKSEEQNKKDNGGTGNQIAQNEAQENNTHAKLSPTLNRLLDEQEKKDAALNKQMIKAMAGTYTGVTDGYNCW